jgi:chitinase
LKNGINQLGKIGPGTIEGGVLDYRDIKLRYEKRLKKIFHPQAQVPYLYGNGVFITYDDPLSVYLKTLYSIEKELGGVAIWEISGDTMDNDLLKIINDLSSY